MLDAATFSTDFKEKAAACLRGALIGVEGFPGRTAAGEFTVDASDVRLLAECPKNMPMMNWSHKKSLKDNERRFQERHLDLIVNADPVKKFFV